MNCTNLSKDLSNDLPKLWTSIIILKGSRHSNIEPNLYHVFAAHSGAFAIDESHSLVDPFFVSFFVTCRNIIYHLHMSHTYSIHIYVRGRYSWSVSPNIFPSNLHHNNLSHELWKNNWGKLNQSFLRFIKRPPKYLYKWHSYFPLKKKMTLPLGFYKYNH